jgi:excinuclease UvrABC nuclease subunit
LTCARKVPTSKNWHGCCLKKARNKRAHARVGRCALDEKCKVLGDLEAFRAMECFDASVTPPVKPRRRRAMVFGNTRRCKALEYRRYNIEGITGSGGDDYATMRQVLTHGTHSKRVLARRESR